jgi:transposase
MFIREKRNKSGSISVQVLQKTDGKNKLLKTIGCSSDPEEILLLKEKAHRWVRKQSGMQELDFTYGRSEAESLLNNIEGLHLAGIELILGRLFDSIGFNQIPDTLFRQLVLSRLSYPVSKLKTTDYLRRYYHQFIDVHQIYRYLDKLYTTQKEQVQQISYAHTLKVLSGDISIVFYDVTTVYFEIDDEDNLRKTGFSKEGRHHNPQIILGLLVSLGGYPLAYEIFDGKKFEGHTMLPVLEHFKKKHKLDKLVVVADSGLISESNKTLLKESGYEYILGARIKNESSRIKEEILAMSIGDGELKLINKPGGNRLIIGYSIGRAKKDKANRERGLAKLEKKIQSGRLTKSSINNRGYNKYLKLKGEIQVSIDVYKFRQDDKWDGLKGYETNSKLTKEEIVANYNHLWRIEKAFRVAKHDLKIRPVFHRKKKRIEAHICITFAAYMVYKELERVLKEKKSSLSPEKVIEIAEAIFYLSIKVPATGELISKAIIQSQEQKMLADLFDFG